MKNSFEVVFEKVPVQKVGELVGELLSHASETGRIEFSEDEAPDHGYAFTPELLSAKMAGGQELTAMIRVRCFAISSAVIGLVLIRVIKYDNIIDLELSFDIDGGENSTTIMQGLHKYAIEIARSFSTGDVYGGMEPAGDCATRYFTNAKSGPMPLSGG